MLNEEELKAHKEALVARAMELLRDGQALITFFKVDGTPRKMLCTLNWNQIPNQHKPTGSGKAINESVISVFDCEKQGWRSIRKEFIIQVEEPKSE